MPWSHTEGKMWLDGEYRRLKPETVVDVGPGAGMYANWFRPMHHAHWTGIEVWGPYINKYRLHEKYDVVVNADVREIELPEADLYIAGDVLEHMTKDEAVVLIERMKAKCKHLFVSVPIIEYHQGAIEGNPYEEHKHHWGFDEMAEVLLDGDPEGLQTWKGEVIGAYHWVRHEKPAGPTKKAPAKKTARKAAPKKAA